MARRLPGARNLLELEVLHRVEGIDQPGLVRVDIKASCLEGEEKLVCRFDRRQAPFGRLALDAEPAGHRRLDCQARQAQQGRAVPHDRSCTVPRGVDEEDDESPGRAGYFEGSDCGC